jgi:23S rRNA (guanine745-N1)-methyltransferase
VAPRPPRAGHGLLRCPVCRADLTPAPGALVCANRHGFDLARDGYVNLLGGSRRRTAAGGDTAAQLRHRAAFHRAGHVRPLIEQVAAHVRPARSTNDVTVLDAGCGSGDVLAGLLAHIGAPTIGLGLDIAVDAARMAARCWPEPGFAVADLWAPWPVRDGATDVLISSFAPKNFPEMARVLRHGGWLGLVYPGPDHLGELVARFGLLRPHAGKAERYRDATRRTIGPVDATRLRYRVRLDSAAIRDAVAMGPAARHTRAAEPDVVEPAVVTLDFVILFARKTIVAA